MSFSIVADGIRYALALIVGGIAVVYLAGPAWSLPMFAAAAFCLNFFRDPQRTVPSGALAVSPADGKVLNITTDATGLRRISIFMNVFDVHVNRSPIAGKITEIQYRKGRFVPADREAAAEENEQNTVTVEGEDTRVVFKQVAGLIARRIVFYKKLGDSVSAGERVGLIKFGSRVDVFLGPEWQIQVGPGERVKAGSSVLAHRETVSRSDEKTEVT